MRRMLTASALILLFAAFLAFRGEVMAGACSGLLLWYRYVLPSLLPFLILTGLMLGTDTVSVIGRLLYPVMKRFPSVSVPGSFVVTAGFLSGFPMGARLSAELVKSGRISGQEGAYLLSFCNNTSPMFVSGVFLEQFIPDKSLRLPLFFILWAAPLLCSLWFRRLHQKDAPDIRLSPDPVSGSAETVYPGFGALLDETLTDSFFAIVRIGLYMMLFGVLIRLLQALLPDCGSRMIRTLLLSSLELTTGLQLLRELALPRKPYCILSMALVSFGGWCAAFQSSSMLTGSGLKVRPYIAEKLITAGVTSFFTYLYLSAAG